MAISHMATGVTTVLRHLLSILALPFVMVVVVPRMLITSRAPDSRWPGGTTEEFVGRVAGVTLFLFGFALFAWCVRLFARVGKGTLAPWDPTTRFVAVGPYRHMRNPMITGVLTMIGGEALFFGSRRVALWLATFFIINQIYFMLFEEPGLERRFGSDYTRYKAAVGRWIPRLKAYRREEIDR
ncbi:MAG TPA: isoprenylcysteine carboxylmethyltransferase family protein [Gemmatimonadaceae bacterium]|nr:isoprenylcysteine carboxylmethyltransferase family protein [Gemmatimonadaceae bacterium]